VKSKDPARSNKPSWTVPCTTLLGVHAAVGTRCVDAKDAPGARNESAIVQSMICPEDVPPKRLKYRCTYFNIPLPFVHITTST
jgi:hypothetical protein